MAEEETDIKSKIIKDLGKSGFGAEMRAMKVLLDAGWETNGSQSYFDLDSEQSREYDIHSSIWTRDKVRDRHVVMWSALAVQVKKSSKPWVVFRHTPNEDWDLEPGWSDVVHVESNLPKVETKPTFDRTSLVQHLGWKGYGVHESFKSPGRPTSWYPAFVTACKAAEHLADDERDVAEAAGGERRYEYDPSVSTRLLMVTPLVVLDGRLFVADLDADGGISVEEAVMAPVDFEFNTSKYFGEPYQVPIVTLGGLREFVRLRKQRHSELRDLLVREARSAAEPASAADSTL